ncbi:hypothetical protein V8C26DRAFT_262878 [Trichoderma gracile]
MVVYVLLHGSSCCLLLAARHLGSSANQDELLQSLSIWPVLHVAPILIGRRNPFMDGDASGRIIHIFSPEGMSTRERRTEVSKGVGSTCLLTSLRPPKLAAVLQSSRISRDDQSKAQ